MWSQGKDFLKKHFVVTIISGNSLFERAKDEPRWFWSPRWQKMEAEADQSLAKGDYRDFDDVDNLFNDLNEEE